MKRHRLKKEWETYIQDYKIADYQRFPGVKNRTYRFIGYITGYTNYHLKRKIKIKLNILELLYVYL